VTTRLAGLLLVAVGLGLPAMSRAIQLARSGGAFHVSGAANDEDPVADRFVNYRYSTNWGVAVFGLDVRIRLTSKYKDGADAMFSLFRKKAKRTPSRSSSKRAPLPAIETSRSGPPSLGGYTVQEVEWSQLASARLTPQHLIHWESALADKKD
jgi:hypothetical protein